jgi:hypothetical protein
LTGGWRHDRCKMPEYSDRHQRESEEFVLGSRIRFCPTCRAIASGMNHARDR